AVRLDAGGEVLRVVAPKARLPERAKEAAQRLVAEEVDSLLGEIELDVARRGFGDAARSLERLVSRRHLRRRVHREVPLVDQPLDQLVEQLGELGLPLFVAVAAKRLEHVGGELPA